MRLFVVAMLTPLLAACGSSEPPSVDFDRPVASVYSTLAAVDGRVDMQGILKTPIVARRQTANEELVYLLGQDGAENRGQITFRVEPIDEGRSRVFVDADIPEVKATIGGSLKFLSESKIEGLLAQRVAALSKRMKNGGLPLAELDELDQAIGFTALALDPKEVNRALDLASNRDALAAAMERELAWSSDNAEDWDSADRAMDDTSGAETYGDEAAGTEISADEAAGSEPEFDTSYGAASEES